MPAICRPTLRRPIRPGSFLLSAPRRIACSRCFRPTRLARCAELWDEFEERATCEARFARALDRLQPMLENVKVGGGTWRQGGITAADVLAKVALIEDGSPQLGQFARQLIDQAVRDGILAADSSPAGT